MLDRRYILQLVTIKKKQNDGTLLQATFAPMRGMNLVSLKKGDVELIQQSTYPLFEERFAGLGALIGPHFYQRAEIKTFPSLPLDLFPHFPSMLAQGKKDPFSHGIGRYVPWRYQADETHLQARITSSDQYQGFLLEQLEGKHFVMNFEASCLEDRLKIILRTKSDSESVIGLHYYFAMGKAANIKAAISPLCYQEGQKVAVPAPWLESPSQLNLPVDTPIDTGFVPLLSHGVGHITLATEHYRLHLTIRPLAGSEYSFQVWHPQGSDFVCVEPISAENPRGKTLNEGALEIDFMID